MSAKGRAAGKEASLPSNPKWVVIEASDGDSRRWPTNTTSNPDAEGNVNFMRPVSINDGLAVKWRLTIGQALAEMLNYDDVDSKSWVLKDWPSGYQFYDHNKGHINGFVRHDLYLVGSDSVARFRSPAEFTPHAYWLMTDQTRDRYNCKCKYCAKKPQREISDAFGLSQRQSGSSSQAHFVDLPRSREKRRKALPAKPPRVFATVRRAPKAVRLPKGPKQHVNPSLENDMRAALGPKKFGERRWAREGELVWVKLDLPIPVDDRTLDPETIQFWPGIIEEVHFKAEITPRNIEESRVKNDSYFSSWTKNEDLDPWTVVHRSMFKINLLVVSKTVLYGSDHILPYQSHAPDNGLLTEVQSVIFDLEENLSVETMPFPSSQDERQAEKALFNQFEAFDPFPSARTPLVHAGNREEYRKTAAGAFAVAIQIASRLTAYWTPFDEWECKLQLPLPSPSGWNDARERLSPTEQLLHQKILGATANVGAHIVETRFQGLWWGPERIWMGDLVRLKFARHQLAPAGTETVKKMSGAGKRGILESEHELLGDLSSLSAQAATSTEADSVMKSVDDVSFLNGEPSSKDNHDTEMKVDDIVVAQDLGASSRSLFLRVDGLFIEQVSSEDGQVANEARMCGMLYELADDDWEPDGDEFGDPVDATNSKASNGPPHISSGATIATPLRNIMPKLGGSSVADAINNSTSRHVPPSSATPGLFGPNPELLSEPMEITDASMDIPSKDGVVNGEYVPPTTSTLVDSQISPSTATTSVEFMDRKSSLHSAPPKTELSAPPNYSLAGPSKITDRVYSTPPPPSSMKFRPILRDGHEAVLPLTTLAGRYYPGLLSNPLLRPRIEAALQAIHERESDAIWALEGLVPGYLNSVDATQFLPRRAQMLRQAEQVAWGELVGYWIMRVSERKNAIVVDDD